MMLPGIVSSYFVNSGTEMGGNVATGISRLSATGAFYWVLYFVLVVAFTYFTPMSSLSAAGSSREHCAGGTVSCPASARARTAEYLQGVVRRITLVGALFLG